MSNRHLMGRRQFLVVSSTCAVATVAVGPKLFAAEAAAAPPKKLAVGFATFGEQAAVMDAATIAAGDGGFISRGARIAVSGASGAPLQPRARRAVELLTHFSYFDGAERRTAPFRAWGCSRTTGCQGSPVSFTVPVDDVQKITFTVGTESGTPEGPGSRRQMLFSEPTQSAALPVVLSVQNEEGTLKLARGFYVFVPLFDGDSDPRWSSFELRQLEGRWTLVDHAGAVAPFEHFVLRVDYATL
jgi:hypothetical protein